MKRMIAILLSLAAATAAQASPPVPNLVFDPVGVWGVAGGNTSSMALRFRGDGVIAAFEIEHRYDARRFTAFVAAAPGAACQVFEDPKSGVGRVRALIAGITPIAPGWRDVCEVHFRIERGVAPGDYPLTVPPFALLCVDANDDVVACSESSQGRLLHVTR